MHLEFFIFHLKPKPGLGLIGRVDISSNPKCLRSATPRRNIFLLHDSILFSIHCDVWDSNKNKLRQIYSKGLTRVHSWKNCEVFSTNIRKQGWWKILNANQLKKSQFQYRAYLI